MKSRHDVIDFCMTLNGVYEDYPFRDVNWTIMRHKDNNKMFAAVFKRFDNIWINVKCNPDVTYMWRNAFDGVIPAYHMNKKHWNSIILNGSVPENEIKNMILDSYNLTKS